MLCPTAKAEGGSGAISKNSFTDIFSGANILACKQMS